MFYFGIVLGVFIGWLVFDQPKFITDAVAKVKARIVASFEKL